MRLISLSNPLPKTLRRLGAGIAILSLCAAPSFASKGKLPARRSQYTVDGDIPTLGEISRYLYGKARRFKEIARWNHIPSPYKISVGQKLILKEPPTLTPEEGRQQLVQMGRRLGLKGWNAEQSILAPRSHPTESNRPEIHEGVAQFERGDFKGAFASFRSGRNIDPHPLPPWFPKSVEWSQPLSFKSSA